MLPFAVCTEFLDLCTVTTESMQCALTEDGSMFRLKFSTLRYERFTCSVYCAGMQVQGLSHLIPAQHSCIERNGQIIGNLNKLTPEVVDDP